MDWQRGNQTWPKSFLPTTEWLAQWMRQGCGLNPSGNQAPHSPSLTCTPLPCSQRAENWKDKEKTHQWKKNITKQNLSKWCKSYCSQLADQCPASCWAMAIKKKNLPFCQYLPSFVVEHNILWYEISLWSICVISLNFSCTPSLLAEGAGWEIEKSLTLWKNCTAVAKASFKL